MDILTGKKKTASSDGKKILLILKLCVTVSKNNV